MSAAGGGEVLLRFRDASLGYGGTDVLSGVDMSVERGSFWGVLGPNGSGKTTLLRTALGLIPCRRGALLGPDGGPGRPRFGYVPQKERLDPLYPLSALAVVAMGADRAFDPLRFWRRRAQDALVRRCLSDCGASHLAHRRMSDLSGGQKQRVLIARALASEPELLVLDEPLAGIDAATQRSLLGLLERLKRDLTVLLVSHRVSAEKGLFTRVAWVDAGRVATGPAAEMLASRPVREAFGGEL